MLGLSYPNPLEPLYMPLMKCGQSQAVLKKQQKRVCKTVSSPQRMTHFLLKRFKNSAKLNKSKWDLLLP